MRAQSHGCASPSPPRSELGTSAHRDGDSAQNAIFCHLRIKTPNDIMGADLGDHVLRHKKVAPPEPTMPSNVRVLRTTQDLQAALLRAKKLEQRSQTAINARLDRYASYGSVDEKLPGEAPEQR